METTTQIAMSTITFVNPILNTQTTVSSVPIPFDHPYIIFAKEVYIWLVPVMVTVLLVTFKRF